MGRCKPYGLKNPKKLDSLRYFKAPKHVKKEDFLKKFAYLKKRTFTKSSDAHFLHIIGEVHCVLNMYDLTFDEFRKTLKGEDGRFIDTEPKEKLQLLYG